MKSRVQGSWVRLVVLLLFFLIPGPRPLLAQCTPCAGANGCLYVDSVGGKNTNAGTSPALAFKNLSGLQAGPRTFVGGQNVCLKRGSTFFSYLNLTSSNVTGTSAVAPLLVDAYGNGPPPIIQGEIPVTGWSNSGQPANVYFVALLNPDTLGAPYDVSMVKMGGVWLTCAGGLPGNAYCSSTGGVSALSHNYQFFYNGNAENSGNCTSGCGLYIYSSTGAPSNVTAVWDGQIQLVDVNGVSYVGIQHLDLENASWYGINLEGAEDNITIANVLADTEVPFNFHGTGFYVHPNLASSHISLINTESDRGFDGYKFACGATLCMTAASLTNCKAYFNRDYGLLDITTSTLSAAYDHCHFYGNQIKWPLVGETSGGSAGIGNLGAFLDPAVKNWKLYTPRVALNFQTVGAQFGADTALNGQLASLGAAPLSIIVATNFPETQNLISQIQSWVTAGYDVSTAGLSNVSYQNPNTLTVQYIGSGSAASLNITSTTFSTTVTGAPADSVSYTFSNPSYTTVQQIEFALRATGKYSAILPQPCGSCSWISAAAMNAKDLASIFIPNVKTAPVTLQFAVAKFLPDELTGSAAWIAANLTGTTGKYVYAYPGTLYDGDTVINADVTAASYDAARGAIAMQQGSDGQVGGYDSVAAAGINANGLIACSMQGWNGLSPLVLQQTIQVLAEKSAVWGEPFLCYWSPGTLSNPQLAAVVADFTASGVTLMTNSSLATFLEGKTNIPNGISTRFYAYGPDGPGSLAFDPAPTYLSPTVGAGTSAPGASYNLDLWGRKEAQFRGGWDIGSQVLVPSFLGGLLPPSKAPPYSGSLHQSNAQLTIIPLPGSVPSLGNLTGEGNTYAPAAYNSNVIFRCTDVNTDPANIKHYSWEITDDGGANARQWNSNHTLLRVVLADTGNTEVLGVNASAHTCTLANTSSKVPAGEAWAATNPNLDYYLGGTFGTTLYARTFDYTHPLTAPSTATAFDYRSCPGLSALNVNQAGTWSNAPSLTYNDHDVAVAFSDLGGQNTGEYVAVYDLPSGGCQVFNTLTGTITGSGGYGSSGTASTAYPFTIHDLILYPGGIAQVSAGNTCTGCPSPHGPFLWQIGGLTVNLLTGTAGGHNTMGYSTFLNLSSAPKVASRRFSTPSLVTFITSNAGVSFPTPEDVHMGWQNVDVLDSYPVFASESGTASGGPVISTPLQQEIWGFFPATGIFLRFAPSMTSGIANNFNFRTQYAITAVSPDGACVAWPTDWEGTLGNTDGVTSSCTLGTNGATACRSDVVITCPQ